MPVYTIEIITTLIPINESHWTITFWILSSFAWIRPTYIYSPALGLERGINTGIFIISKNATTSRMVRITFCAAIRIQFDPTPHQVGGSKLQGLVP
ncbi:uncharacterized protein G2W53_042958 [Senna tora]|uniref:Uncharacterized protein n=1 Tax=Senna tora TaxID=362788 RepID=A0A834SHT0_9FABA|nr:uncharacterized protein G2W53_042958 [Senna tora]